MVMCVNKPRGDDLVSAVNNLTFRSFRRGDVSSDLGDLIADYEQVCFGRCYVIFRVKNKESAISQKERGGGCHEIDTGSPQVYIPAAGLLSGSLAARSVVPFA